MTCIGKIVDNALKQENSLSTKKIGKEGDFT